MNRIISLLLLIIFISLPVFPNQKYTVIVKSGKNGSITPRTATYGSGENASFSIVPSTGYKISKILLDGSNVSITNDSGQTVAINNIKSKHSLFATFIKKTFIIHIEKCYTSIYLPDCIGQSIIDTSNITVNSGDNYKIDIPSEKTIYFEKCKSNDKIYLVQIFVNHDGIELQDSLQLSNIQENNKILLIYGLEIPSADYPR